MLTTPNSHLQSNDEAFSVVRFSFYGFITIIFFALSACGFQPMAARQVQKNLPGVEITSRAENELQISASEFKYRLEDLMKNGNNEKETKYKLDVTISTAISEGLIAPDGKAQRYSISMNSSYRLSDISEGKLLDSGTVYRVGSYNNRPNVYFSTFVSEQDNIKRLSAELAEEYYILLNSKLQNIEKIGKNSEKPAQTRGIFKSIF